MAAKATAIAVQEPEAPRQGVSYMPMGILYLSRAGRYIIWYEMWAIDEERAAPTYKAVVREKTMLEHKRDFAGN